MQSSMTSGKPFGLLVRFSLPILAGCVLQQMYSLCDSVIVGRLLGVEAFAAVGCASVIGWLPLSMLLGLTQGFGVLLAQRFGAEDGAGLRYANGWSLLISLLTGLAMTAVGLLLLGTMLGWLQTPSELLAATGDYLRVLWLGLSATALYNACASLLRALGDSKTPFWALVISTVFNIVLDCVLVAAFHMGVRGVALSTVLAQVLSLVFCVLRIRKLGFSLPKRAEWHESRDVPGKLLRLGMPPLFRNGIVAVGGLCVQAVMNGFGVALMAGMTAARRYFSLLEMVGAALEGAVATFVGQNTGAGRTDRIAQGMRVALGIAMSSAVVIAAGVWLLAEPMIALFVTHGAAEVLEKGITALRITVLFLPILYALYLYRAALQGMGDTLTPMFSGFAELLLRVLFVLWLPGLIGEFAVYLADAAGWVAAAVLLVSVYYRKKAKSIREALSQ